MQKLMIGHPLTVSVFWYDDVPVPPIKEVKEGEVIGWRESQLVVRVPGYSVLRFWKKNGVEVGNKDHERRGWRVDMEGLRYTGNNNEPVKLDGQKPTGIDTDV
jgi:hypothetical protein